MRLLRSGLIYTAANLAVAGLPFLLLPVLTRALAPAEYGKVVAFALLVVLAGAFAGFNVHAAVGVMWFRRKAEDMRALVAAAVWLAVFSTLLVAPVLALILMLFPTVGAGLHPLWGCVAAITAGANVVLQARLSLWQAQEKPFLLGGLQISTAALNLALSLLAVLILGWGAAGRNGGIALATLVAAATAVFILARRREMGGVIRPGHFRDLIRFGAPLTLHILAASALSTADRWAVSFRLDAETLGIYGAGAQLGMVMAILGDAFVKAFAPWLYGRLSGGGEEDQLRVVGAAYAVIPAFLLLGLAVGVVLHATAGVVLGPRYAASTVVLPWFMLGGALNGVYLSTSSLYFFSGRTGLLAVVTMTSGAISLAVTIALTWALGMTGAAMGYAAAQGLLGLTAFLVAIRSFNLPWGRPFAALRRVASDLPLALPAKADK